MTTCAWSLPPRRPTPLLLALPLFGAVACASVRNQSSSPPTKVENPAASRPAGYPLPASDSMRIPRVSDATGAIGRPELAPVSDSVIRRAVSAAYENAGRARQQRRATIWILAESTGDVVATLVESPNSAATVRDSLLSTGASDQYSFEETARRFPRVPIGRRGLEFTQITRMVIDADTITTVWAQLLAERSR